MELLEHVVYAIYSFSIMLFTVLLGNKNVGKRESEGENIIHGKKGAAKREVFLSLIPH